MKRDFSSFQNSLSIYDQMRTNSWVRKIRRSLVNIKFRNSDLFSCLSQHVELDKIDFVFDVGANIGQFVSDLRFSGYGGSIFSFEPSVVPFDKLKIRTNLDPSWEAFRCALGSSEGKATLFNSANNFLSSSILPMNQIHEEVYPGSHFSGEESVHVTSIDTFIEESKLVFDTGLLKLDVQGYELEVLKGATKTLSNFALVVCEVSLVDFYKGQADLLSLLTFMKEMSFGVEDVFPIFTDRDSHAKQLDILFVRQVG